jgi:nucleoside 2-deoxyribosyltransferase
MDRTIKVYVAGPYSHPDMVKNTRRAIIAGDNLRQLGFLPFIPHATTILWDMLCPHGYEYWMEFDFAWLAQCDCLLRLHGESSGADREVAYCLERKIPVFHSIPEICKAVKEGRL